MMDTRRVRKDRWPVGIKSNLTPTGQHSADEALECESNLVRTVLRKLGMVNEDR
jgi:hypothetical protein